MIQQNVGCSQTRYRIPALAVRHLLQPWCLFTNTAGNSQKQRAVLLLFGLPNRRRSRISAANETSLPDNLPRNSENSKRRRMGVEGDRGMGMPPRAEDLAAL